MNRLDRYKRFSGGILLEGEPAPVSQPDGFILAADGTTVADTLQCVHCNNHFVVTKGSGRRRGFCRNCMGPLCGEKACFTCVPYEKQMDLTEAGLSMK